MLTADINQIKVSRKIWYWSASPNAQGAICRDENQPFDATIVYVHRDNTVNVVFKDHDGNIHRDTHVEVHDPADENAAPEYFNAHGVDGVSYCTWMPYQKKQHDKQAQENNNAS